jgi:hypothetical protein
MLRGADIDHVATVREGSGGKPEPIFVEDAIMYDNISPTQLVQYTFSTGLHFVTSTVY